MNTNLSKVAGKSPISISVLMQIAKKKLISSAETVKLFVTVV
jgi:hypothetical protein